MMTNLHSFIKITVIGLALLFGAVVTGQAYFFDYGAGVRPCGMGRAFVAVADDVNTINWNPAGLILLDKYEGTMMFSSLFSGFDGRLYSGETDVLGYSFIAAAIPVSPLVGNFGISWAQFGSAFYRENTINLSYARTFVIEGNTFHAGGNLKILNWIQDANDYTAGLYKTNMTADIGLLYPLPRNFTAGLMIENILPADVGFTTSEIIPRNVRLGVSWKQNLKPLDAIIDNVLVTAEIVNRSYAQNKNTFRFGGESWFFNGLAAGRLGVNSTEFTVGFSGKYAFPELNMTEFQIDYAFSLPFYIQKTIGSHRVALTVRPSLEFKKKKRIVKAEIKREPIKVLPLPEPTIEEVHKAKVEKLEKAFEVIEEKITKLELKPILFKSGTSRLQQSSYDTLNWIGATIKKYPDLKIVIEGHTDSIGKATVNLRLSKKRAGAIKRFLQSNFKITSSQLSSKGYGESRPIASNKTASGRRKNRRVEFHVLSEKIEKKAMK